MKKTRTMRPLAKKTSNAAANPHVRALFKAARANPAVVAGARLDRMSVVRREVFADEPVGVVLALAGLNDNAPHRLQRNTEGRLSNHKKTAYLRNGETVPTPQHIIQFVYFGEQFEVVDGNHRLTLWSDVGETCKVPATVTLVIHYPKDEAEYRLVYRCIDSMEARKTGQDTLYGVFRAIGFKPGSELFLSQKMCSAIQFVTKCDSSPDGMLEGAQKIFNHLQTLDSIGFKASPRVSYSSGVWAGLLTLFIEGKSGPASDFARDLNQLRVMPGYVGSIQAERFLDEYRCMSAPGAAGNISKVVAMVRKYYQQYENAVKESERISGGVRAQSRQVAA